MRLWGWWRRGEAVAPTSPEASDPDALKEIEDQIKPNLGTPALLPVYQHQTELLRKLSDVDLVYIHRVDPSRGAGIELDRRITNATRELEASLDSANDRIYFLNAILTIYTAALLIATVVLVWRTH
jgi:hypothetical protein